MACTRWSYYGLSWEADVIHVAWFVCRNTFNHWRNPRDVEDHIHVAPIHEKSVFQPFIPNARNSQLGSILVFLLERRAEVSDGVGGETSPEGGTTWEHFHKIGKMVTADTVD